LQPPVKMVATRPATNKARYSGRETTVIRILLRVTWNTRVRPTEGNIVTPAGWFRAISRITIYCYTGAGLRETKIRRLPTPRLHMRCERGRKCYKFFYLEDQLGDSLCPDMVSSWACVPSASMVQIWRSPLRVDSKTIWRPSGAQLGRSFLPLSRVI